MKVTIDLGKLLEFYDRNGKEYSIDCGDGFRAFILDFVCSEMNETSTETNYQYRRRPIFNDILFKSRDTAEQVIEIMSERAATKGFVTIADYYHFANQKVIESIMYNWGWRDMKGAYVYGYNDHGTEAWGIHFSEALPIEHFRG